MCKYWWWGSIYKLPVRLLKVGHLQLGLELPLFYNDALSVLNTILSPADLMRRGFSIVPERVDDQFCLQYLYIYVSSVGQISPLAGLYRYIIINMNTHYEWCEKCELSFFISFINLDSLINGPLYRFCHPLYT